jgi:hypothetical protein
MHLRLESLVQVSLAEWAATDAQWWTEAVTLLTAYREGIQMRQGMEQARHSMQA